MRNFLTFALFAVPAVAFAQAQGAPTVAIAEVTARGNADADMASEVNDALTDQLVSDGRFRVVERQQIAKVMKEQMLAQSGVMSDEVQIKVAQLVGARFIVLGSVGTKGRSYALSLRALDSTSAQVASSSAARRSSTPCARSPSPSSQLVLIQVGPRQMKPRALPGMNAGSRRDTEGTG